MKIRHIFFIIICLFFTGCGEQGFFKAQNEINYNVLSKNYSIVTIESCEYIVYSVTGPYAGYGFMAHKGNCRNPIHVYNKE